MLDSGTAFPDMSKLSLQLEYSAFLIREPALNEPPTAGLCMRVPFGHSTGTLQQSFIVAAEQLQSGILQGVARSRDI